MDADLRTDECTFSSGLFANPLTWAKLNELSIASSQKYQLEYAPKFPTLPLGSNQAWIKVCMFFCHLLPTFLLNLYRLVMFKRPVSVSSPLN